MGSILNYAGVSAKLAAMASRFLKKKDYDALMTKESVSEITKYLQETMMYSGALKDVNTEEIHRRDLETILKADLVKDVRKFLTFFVTLDRAFASYLLRRYEVDNLKLAIRNALMESEAKKNIQELKGKFYDIGNKALIDPMKVASSSTKEEILGNLENTPYQEVIRNIFASYKSEQPNLVGAIENALDRWLFFGILKATLNLKSGDSLVIKEMVGERVELTNVEWIVRAKEFYSLKPEELYNSLIPMRFRLNVSDLHKLCDAANINGVLNVIADSPYKELLKDLNVRIASITPDMITRSLRRFLYKKAKKSLSVFGGFSIASFFHYSYIKEYEIMDIITITEGVRYGMKPDEIKDYLIRSF